jgi:hypothetical protein
MADIREMLAHGPRFAIVHRLPLDRLLMTRTATRGEKPVHQFLDELGLAPTAPT